MAKHFRNYCALKRIIKPKPADLYALKWRTDYAVLRTNWPRFIVHIKWKEYIELATFIVSNKLKQIKMTKWENERIVGRIWNSFYLPLYVKIQQWMPAHCSSWMNTQYFIVCTIRRWQNIPNIQFRIVYVRSEVTADSVWICSALWIVWIIYLKLLTISWLSYVVRGQGFCA